jgi:adenosylhomocysteinase
VPCHRAGLARRRVLQQRDEKVAQLHVERIGVHLTTLTAEQAAYIGVLPHGSFNPDHYKF